jgi:hypothetical protein|tara:strand:+ start:39 stop:473 length:435 start_codon:yes stop_codon:yes gene_type:complete
MKQLSLFNNERPDSGISGKKCTKCTEILPLSFFSYHSGSNYLRPECKKCNNELGRVRNYLKGKHGMPQKDYICPICNGSEEKVKGKGNLKNGSWVLDHCHETDSFRGWLCHKCNRALGCFDDNIETIYRAIKYLKKNEVTDEAN